jgi:hypothetical protein
MVTLAPGQVRSRVREREEDWFVRVVVLSFLCLHRFSFVRTHISDAEGRLSYGWSNGAVIFVLAFIVFLNVA